MNYNENTNEEESPISNNMKVIDELEALSKEAKSKI